MVPMNVWDANEWGANEYPNSNVKLSGNSNSASNSISHSRKDQSQNRNLNYQSKGRRNCKKLHNTELP